MSWYFLYIAYSPLIFLLIYFFSKRKNTALEVASNDLFKNLPITPRLVLRKYFLPLFLILSFILIALGASRPYMEKVISKPSEKRNIMLSIDISNSMLTRDYFYKRYIINRLQATKTVLTDFIQKRVDDRIGLVIFGTKAFLQAPLTTDKGAIKRIIRKIEVGQAGGDTALGDGLGLAIRHVEKINAKASSIILLTDGVQTAGNVNVLEAAKIASKLNIKVHTIGLGSKQSQNGFDTTTLRKIAEITKGKYFSPKNSKELSLVYEEINKLEKSKNKDERKKIMIEYFYHFAKGALVVLFLYFLLGTTYLKVAPE